MSFSFTISDKHTTADSLSKTKRELVINTPCSSAAARNKNFIAKNKKLEIFCKIKLEINVPMSLDHPHPVSETEAILTVNEITAAINH